MDIHMITQVCDVRVSAQKKKEWNKPKLESKQIQFFLLRLKWTISACLLFIHLIQFQPKLIIRPIATAVATVFWAFHEI